MALDVLNWSRPDCRDQANFAMESRLLYGQNSGDGGGGGGGWMTLKMQAVTAILATLGGSGEAPPAAVTAASALQFPRASGVRQAALLLFREKGGKHSMVRVSARKSKGLIWTNFST